MVVVTAWRVSGCRAFRADITIISFLSPLWYGIPWRGVCALRIVFIWDPFLLHMKLGRW